VTSRTKIGLTGASGFIGRALCSTLPAAGYEPVLIDLRTANGLPGLKDLLSVVHLAAVAHRRADTEELRRVNVEITERLGRQVAAAGPSMIFLSSVKVHGEESTQPFREHSPIVPADPYAASKARAEEALRAIPGIRLTVLRPPLVYGPAVRANFLALMNAVARGVPLPFGRVANRRSLVYVGNVVDVILRCIANGDVLGRTYLLSDGAPVATPELCRNLGHALGRPARLFPFPVRVLEALPAARKLTRSLEIDDSAVRQDLGWRPPFSFEEGLRVTASWYRNR
jgi:nucleoside-diphosphate-sugar epimerase